ncbi:MAG: hypothetical protein WCG98_09815 [bacterium]
MYDTWVPDETNSSREILDATNVKVWNPTGVLGDSLTSNSL